MQARFFGCCHKVLDNELNMTRFGGCYVCLVVVSGVHSRTENSLCVGG